MKASKEFIDMTEKMVRELRDKFGPEIYLVSPMRLYNMVYCILTPGHEHNAKLEPRNEEWYHEESKNLTDDNILAVIRKVCNKISPDRT